MNANKSGQAVKHLAFGPLLALLFVLWMVYRFSFHFPVWFDEFFSKAMFFGLPVLLYAKLAPAKNVAESFDINRLQPGLLIGIVLGGLYGFVGVLASFLRRGVIVHTAPLFLSDVFWWEFAQAMATGLWESLFFYGLIMTVVQEKYKQLSLTYHVLIVTGIFLLFHIANTLLRFAFDLALFQVFLLGSFAVGQALIFARYKNVYALAVSHAFWGMVLLIHTR